MRLSTLQQKCPAWTWRAVRQGFGWIYEGTRGDETVNVTSAACLVDEDDFETRWFVHHKNLRSESLGLWLMKEGQK